MAIETNASRLPPIDFEKAVHVYELEESLREKYQDGLNPNVADARIDLVLYLATRSVSSLRHRGQTPEQLDAELIEKIVEPLKTATEVGWEKLGEEFVGRGMRILESILDDAEHDMESGIDPILGEQNARFLINLGNSVIAGSPK